MWACKVYLHSIRIVPAPSQNQRLTLLSRQFVFCGSLLGGGGGNRYIEEHVTEEKRKIAGGSGERHKLMSYWGYRFETICNISKPVSELQRVKTRKRASPDVSSSSLAHKALVTESRVDQRHKEPVTEDTRLPQGAFIEKPSDTGSATKQLAEEEKESDDEFEQVDQVDLNDPELLARLDGVVDTNLQYCTVARTKIGQNSIIMGAEVDCTSGKKHKLKIALVLHVSSAQTEHRSFVYFNF